MEKARFVQFRSDFFKLYNQIKDYHPHIVGYFVETYPEFNVSYVFPDEVTEQLQMVKRNEDQRTWKK